MDQITVTQKIGHSPFFKRLFGPHYKATYKHTDEQYPHLHVYALPHDIPGVDATTLHPGKRAKAKAEAEALAEGLTNRDAVAAGNKALKVKMRKFQDLYFQEVGEPCGLLRLGPKRQRLSRKDYQAQKHAAKQRSISELEARSEDIARKEAEIQQQQEQLSKAAQNIQMLTSQFMKAIGHLAKLLGFEQSTSLRATFEAIQKKAAEVQAEVFESVKPETTEERPTPM